MTALAGLLLGVAVSVVSPYQGSYGIESLGPSPSGNRAVLTARGKGTDSRRVAVVMRDYGNDGSYSDKKICGSVGARESDRRRNAFVSDWVGAADEFAWLDEERVMFVMWWRELQVKKSGLVYWDGNELGVLAEGVSGFDISPDGKWVVMGTRFGEFSGQVLKNVETYTTRTIVPGSGRVAGAQIYYETEENRCIKLRSFDIASGSDREVCKYDGRILAKSRQGALASMITGRKPGVPGPPGGDWGLVPGLPDMLVIDGAGGEHWLKMPEEEASDEETIRIGRGLFSPDGELLLLAVDKTNERTELTVWKRYYVVNWRDNQWTEVARPTQEGMQFDIFRYWRPDGVWWRTSRVENGKVVRGWGRVQGFDEVKAE